MDAHAAIGELIAEIEASEKIRIVLAGLVGQKESQQLRESRKLRFVGSLSSLGNLRGLGSLGIRGIMDLPLDCVFAAVMFMLS